MLSSREFLMPPLCKAELLERIEKGWEVLQQTLVGLSHTQLETYKDEQQWSILDHLAHIAAWENVLVALLQSRPLHTAFGLERAAYEQVSGVDEINSLLRKDPPQRPVRETLASCQQSHRRAVWAVIALPEADWSRPISFFQPDEDDQRSILVKLVGDTYRHYEEHRYWIEAIIASV